MAAKASERHGHGMPVLPMTTVCDISCSTAVTGTASSHGTRRRTRKRISPPHARNVSARTNDAPITRLTWTSASHRRPTRNFTSA
jgi:hypothetical protein